MRQANLVPRRIALCVDDFGLHEGVTGAVMKLAGLGRVNAVSCMVGAPAWSSDCQHLRALDRQRIDLGLHLDLTEFPMRAHPRLRLRDLITAAYAGTLSEPQLLGEINAQLDIFEQALNRMPDYIDGHQHVHQLPVVRDALLRALRLRYPPSKVWLRSTRQARAGGVLPGLLRRSRWKSSLIEALGSQALARLARRGGFGQNRHLLGVHDFRTDVCGYRRLMAAWLRAASDGDLLLSHPSLPQENLDDALLGARSTECTVLCEAAFGQALALEGILLAPISQILASA